MTSHRDAILARRARFIAAALAGVGIGACTGESSPQVCLAPIGDSGVVNDVSVDADASAGAGGSAGSTGADSGGADSDDAAHVGTDGSADAASD